MFEEVEDMVDWFERVSSEAGVAQLRTLREILRQNCGVEYLNQWLGDVNIHQIPDDFALESLFTSLVPLSSHADFEPFLQRIADGDSSPLLTQQPIQTLSLRYTLLQHFPLHFMNPLFITNHIITPLQFWHYRRPTKVRALHST